MPTFYNYTENGVVYSFDDVFVPVDAFRQGGLWTWGLNTSGQIGVNDTNGRTTPVTTFAGGINWKQVSASINNTAAIKTDGTLWTWGANGQGQLGINDTNTRTTPVVISSGATDWKQVACGNAHTAAIKTDGTLWTWGFNNNGQLGVNDTTNRNTPVVISSGATNWKQVTCGTNFTAAIKTDGTLWTWGSNSYGQLGVNDTNTRTTPVVISSGGTNWKQVACGQNHTSAIKTDGTLWTWGDNTTGQLGVNDTNGRTTPVVISSGATNWKQVSASINNTAAIKTDGTLWTWGANGRGQLGINDTNTRCTPVVISSGGTNWKQVTCGGSHTAAIKTDGTLWTWGFNNNGQLGVNDTNTRTTPVVISSGATDWKQVACGNAHTAAITYIDNYQ